VATPDELEEVARLRGHILQLEAQNVELRDKLERLERVRAELPLAGLVDSVGLAAALGEATMPDRVVSSIAVSAQAYLVPTDGGIGVRFPTPELAERPAGLSTASFELGKVPGIDGTAPRSLYVVLEEKQHLYGREPWSSYEAAQSVVVELARVLANTGAWSIPFLAEAAATVGGLERKLAAALVAGRPREAVATYREAAVALVELAGELAAKSRPVGGDVLRLSAAFDATTRAGAALEQAD
jgi:hypothetical protein